MFAQTWFNNTVLHKMGSREISLDASGGLHHYTDNFLTTAMMLKRLLPKLHQCSHSENDHTNTARVPQKALTPAT